MTLLDDVIARVVEVAQPDRIVLFGSRARGTATTVSDIDLLVVKSGKMSRRRLAQSIYRSLVGIPVPVDVVVVTPEDIEQYEGGKASIIGPALREGRVVYAA